MADKMAVEGCVVQVMYGPQIQLSWSVTDSYASLPAKIAAALNSDKKAIILDVIPNDAKVEKMMTVVDLTNALCVAIVVPNHSSLLVPEGAGKIVHPGGLKLQ